MVELKDGITYYYRPVYSEEKAQSFANRFIYRYEYIDGTEIEFYTRFYYGEDFFEELVDKEKRIETLLLPSQPGVAEVKELIFAESARISLSANGAVVWLDYKKGSQYEGRLGSISCYSETIVQN